jgi:hypothetical protein
VVVGSSFLVVFLWFDVFFQKKKSFPSVFLGKRRSLTRNQLTLRWKELLWKRRLLLLPSPSSFDASGSEPLIYKGMLELPDNFVPSRSCKDELLASEAVLAKHIPRLKEIIADCEIAA